MTLGNIFLLETLGTATLILFGCGVVANAILPKTKGNGGGWLMINFGWGLGVFAGVYVAMKSGGHLNPAVTLGLAASGLDEFADGIAVNLTSIAVYIAAQFLGAMIGAVLTYLAYKNHFDQEAPGATKLGVFSTGPEVRSYGWNFVTEVIGTFALVFVVLAFGNSPADLGALPVALLIVGIGASIGGPTGYAINPARDLGPRIAHALLPIKGKGPSDWGYSWVPVVGPIVGGVAGGLAGAWAF